MADESPLDRFKQALTGAARAIAHEPEADVAWTADVPAMQGKAMRGYGNLPGELRLEHIGHFAVEENQQQDGREDGKQAVVQRQPEGHRASYTAPGVRQPLGHVGAPSSAAMTLFDSM